MELKNAVCPGLIDSKWVHDGYGLRFAAMEARCRRIRRSGIIPVKKIIL